MSFPQLRVRSGYSYRNAYGKCDDITARLADIGCSAAAMVDSATWSHVRWEKAATKAGINSMFGMEVPILTLDEAGEDYVKFKPSAWMLAASTQDFYSATSKSTKGKGLTPAEFDGLEGVIRFSGAAIEQLLPGQYDYVDINPSSLLLASQSIRRAREEHSPIVITSYNDMPSTAHRPYAHAWEVRESVGMRHIATEDELWSQLHYVMNRQEFDQGVQNAYAIADALRDVQLAKAPLIQLDGDLMALCRLGMSSRVVRGHIPIWTQEYEDRLVFEVQQIQMKQFDSYFLCVADLVKYAKQHMLVGPARGSAAGSLVCYLLEITEVDPIPFKLLFQRFIDVSRADLPDIDIDFNDAKRYMVFDYLREKYGIESVAKLGNINTLQGASVMAQVGKKFGMADTDTFSVKNSLIKYPAGDVRHGRDLEDTLATTEAGRDFVVKFPAAADCMQTLEAHPSHTGVHAAGILVCNEPLTYFCTVTEEGIAQLDKPDAEYLNLLKIDILGLRTLGIIEDSGVVTAEQLYGLKLDDPAVLQILNDDKVSGVFQFEGPTLRETTRVVNVDSFEKIDNLTALARPGPLASGMATKYIARASGREPVTYDVPQLKPFLEQTYGIFLYQEQVMEVVKNLGNFDWVKTSAVRKAMSSSKGAEYLKEMGAEFIEGAATHGIPSEKAAQTWAEIVAFGGYCFNKSHSVAYAVVTYWTCWLKQYHKLEFAAACLRAAKDDEQTIAILRELAVEGVTYKALDPDLSEMNWLAVEGNLVGGIQNAKGYGAIKALQYVEKRRAGLLTDKDRERLAKAEVRYADLAEAHTKWGHFYRNPELAGVQSGNPIINMAAAENGDNVLVIAKLVKSILGDKNSRMQLAKRGGKPWKNNMTRYLDMEMIDDSVDSPIRFRINPENYETLGENVYENYEKGQWFLVKAWKMPRVSMFFVKNIKALHEPVKRAESVGLVSDVDQPGVIEA